MLWTRPLTSMSLASYDGDIDFGTTTLNLDGEDDGFVAKLTGATGEPVWAVRQHGTTLDQALQLTTFGADVVVGGLFYSEDLHIGTETLSHTVPAMGFIPPTLYIARLASSDGSTVWARTIGNDGHEHLYGLTSDGTHIYAVGTFGADSLDIDGTVLPTVGDGSVFLTRLAGSTGAASWSSVYGGPQHGDPASPQVANGTLFIGGHFRTMISLGSLTVTDEGAGNAYLGAVNAVDGMPLWLEGGAAVGASRINAIAARDDALWAGSWLGDATLLQADPTSGAATWLRDFGSNRSDAVESIAIDSVGGVVFGGWFDGSSFVMGDRNAVTAGGRDAYVGSIRIQ